MSDQAAAKCREIVQMYAELYPKPVTLALVRPRPNKQFEMLKSMGEVSPIGLALINWDSRMIEWRNHAYAKIFLNAFDVESQSGVRLGSLVPEFETAGIDKVFARVANTGEPFRDECFTLPMPSGMTYWNCSLSRLPDTEGETYLFLQLQQVQAPAQTLAA